MLSCSLRFVYISSRVVNVGPIPFVMGCSGSTTFTSKSPNGGWKVPRSGNEVPFERQVPPTSLSYSSQPGKALSAAWTTTSPPPCRT